MLCTLFKTTCICFLYKINANLIYIIRLPSCTPTFTLDLELQNVLLYQIEVANRVNVFNCSFLRLIKHIQTICLC
ncbi:hypothetical protein QVD17_18109 [Tagetes erecta]|uniref:Uncharacterized protein n=1 Tax=Tagetes erecta TaxID=13708 RepID=A0AAD8NNM2_TARER|nr:hypothetical protein QVD17_18109 [Tagetes erecta]